MAFCSNCGAQASGAFCPNCGATIGTSASTGSSASSGVGAGFGASAPPPVTVASGMEPHIAGALCYTPFAIGIIASIVFLLVTPYNQNRFVRFSAFQSLFLHLGLFLFFVALSIVFGIVTAMIHIFAVVLLPLWPLLWIGSLILFLFMMYKSFNNQKVKLPFIGDLADKQA